MAVNVPDVAIPEALVTAVLEGEKAPLAPLIGALKETLAPFTGLPPASFTCTTRGAAKAVFAAALCGVPLIAIMVAGGPALFVSWNVAGAATPATEAFTP